MSIRDVALAGALLAAGYGLARHTVQVPPAPVCPAARAELPLASEVRIAQAVAGQLEGRLGPRAAARGAGPAAAAADEAPTAESPTDPELLAQALDTVRAARGQGRWTIADGDAIRGPIAELDIDQRAEVAAQLMMAINVDGMALEPGAYLP
jgi:hypothetical protein